MKKIIIYPVVIALWPILLVYIENVEQLSATDVIWTVILVALIVLAFWWLVNLWVKDIQKSALITFIFMGLFFTFRNIILVVGGSFLKLGWIDDPLRWFYSETNTYIWLSLWLLIFVVGVYLILKSNRFLNTISQFLNIFSFVLVVLIGIGLLQSSPVHSLFTQDNENQDVFVGDWLEEQEQSIQISTPGSPEILPDIYYIILDGYARQDILEDIYRYDNREFTAALVEKGFFVASESRSNYNRTLYSLSSSLNMVLLDSFASELSNALSYSPLINLIQSSLVFKKFDELGYHTVSYQSGYPYTEIKTTDEYVIASGQKINLFQNEVLNLTPLSLILLDYQYNIHRARIENAFDTIPAFSIDGQPTLVFAHIINPHPPFVFDADGNPKRPGRWYTIFDADTFFEYGSQDEYILGYTDQVTFVNRQVLEMVDEILARSEIPPIIILQADHGPGLMFEFENLENSYLPERMSILNTYYFPGQAYENLYTGITPANSFRVVLNQFFGGDLPLLEDRSFVGLETKPYDFIDVTESLDEK
jgi:hypothetical protein